VPIKDVSRAPKSLPLRVSASVDKAGLAYSKTELGSHSAERNLVL
jgi:hypothetical protein